jgi:magnesium transporter
VWLDVTGIPSPSALAAIGRAFELHPLSLEDVLSPGKRPKVEHYDQYDFIVLRALAASPEPSESPVSVVVGRGFVITFEEGRTGVVEPVRGRLRNGRGHVRERGPDYLAYAVIDSVIDHYFPVMEELDDRLGLAESRVLEPGSREVVGSAADIRRDIRSIRHAVWPLREVLASMIHDGGQFLTSETQLYLRDSYDHVVQLQEMIEFSREVSANLLEAYISTVSLETNRVMRVLTLIATIFIPLTFITGVYGMNFDPTASPFNMPELGWRWGYPFSLGLMLGTAVALLWFFRRKGWLGSRRRRS